jgi:hypothetical protein
MLINYYLKKLIFFNNIKKKLKIFLFYKKINKFYC